MVHRGVLLATLAALTTWSWACAEVVVDSGADSEVLVIYCNIDAGEVDGPGSGTERCPLGYICGVIQNLQPGYLCCSVRPPDSGLINN